MKLADVRGQGGEGQRVKEGEVVFGKEHICTVHGHTQ